MGGAEWFILIGAIAWVSWRVWKLEHKDDDDRKGPRGR
jgi:hypothetical protein